MDVETKIINAIEFIRDSNLFKKDNYKTFKPLMEKVLDDTYTEDDIEKLVNSIIPLSGEETKNETIKENRQYLRGTLQQSIANEITGGLAVDDTQIIKFHGFYQQDDRDLRQHRKELLLEPYYSFMLRARLPGGVCTPQQWLTIDAVGR